MIGNQAIAGEEQAGNEEAIPFGQSDLARRRSVIFGAQEFSTRRKRTDPTCLPAHCCSTRAGDHQVTVWEPDAITKARNGAAARRRQPYPGPHPSNRRIGRRLLALSGGSAT